MTPEEGWQDHGLIATGPSRCTPLAALQYGQEIFEGLAAYRHPDGSVWLFRPRANAARLVRSVQRMAMPVLLEDDFVASVSELVAHNLDWVPSGPEQSLYLRPFMFGSETPIGVRSAPAVHLHPPGHARHALLSRTRCACGFRRPSVAQWRAGPGRPSAVATTARP